MMRHPLLMIASLLIPFGLLVQWVNLKLAMRYGLLDIPTARRRHKEPVPVTGGFGVILCWAIGLVSFSLLNKPWIDFHMGGAVLVMACTIGLVILGLIDDLRGLTPFWKLAIE